MKIAMIGQKGIPAYYGGIERHVDELSTRLATKNHEVVVYCRSWFTGETDSYRGVRVIVTPTIRAKHLDAIVHTFTSTIHALREGFDVYHYHGVGPSLLAFLPRIFRPRAKTVVTFHCLDRIHAKWGLFARLMLRLGEWTACRFAHETITVSRTLAQYCKDVYDSNTHYIPNGVSTPISADNNLISSFGFEPNKYIAFVARLVPHKGAHVLIEAWQELSRRSPELMNGYKLAIIGDSVFTNPYVLALKEMSKNDETIVFTGFQNGAMLDGLFSNALFMVHPTFTEGHPISVLEAMSYGKVVLASDIPADLEAIGEYGVSFKTGDVEDLIIKMRALLETKEELSKLGDEARKFVLKNFHWDDIADKVEKLYMEGLKKNKVGMISFKRVNN